jgi:hypothetical protein
MRHSRSAPAHAVNIIVAIEDEEESYRLVASSLEQRRRAHISFHGAAHRARWGAVNEIVVRYP